MYYVTKSDLVLGDGIVTLTDDTWYLIDAVASSSEFPSGLGVGDIFKSKASSATITPATGDNYYTLTLTEKCKGDLSTSGSKGTIEVTDSCSEGNVQYIIDGFTDISGSFTSFMKLSRTDGLKAGVKEFLKRFFKLVDDNAAETYTVTSKTDNEVILMTLLDERNVTANDEEVWMIYSVHLTELTMDKPLKGVQNFDISFALGQDVKPSIYTRTVV